MKKLEWAGRMKRLICGLGILFALLPVRYAGAVDSLQDLNEDLPFRMEDATPTPAGTLQVQASTLFEHQKGVGDRYQVQPVIQYGLSPLAEIKLGAKGRFGSGDKSGSGDIEPQLLVAPIPDRFAIAAQATIPTGVESHGVDPTFALLGSQPLGSDAHRVHLNLRMRHNFEAQPGERQNRYEGIIGYTAQAGGNLLLGVDFVRAQELQEESDETITQAGLIYEACKSAQLSLALGSGLTEESPGLIATLGLQWSPGG